MRIQNLFVLLLLLVAGCGGGGHYAEERQGPPPPASIHAPQFQPNYAGDLLETNYWEQPEVTYRIMTAESGATALRYTDDGQPVPIGNVTATERQATDTRDAFVKLQAAFSQNDPQNRRMFREVPATSPADIDVVIQTPAQFDGLKEDGREEFGDTRYWLRDIPAGKLGRAVIRIRSDLPVRTFRFTIVHEGIHALGLLGHSRGTGVILQETQYFGFVPVVELTERDNKTLCAVYTRN